MVPEEEGGEEHGEDGPGEEDGGAVADGQPLHRLEDEEQEEASQHTLGEKGMRRGTNGGLEEEARAI